jgi:hypothetical protein
MAVEIMCDIRKPGPATTYLIDRQSLFTLGTTDDGSNSCGGASFDGQNFWVIVRDQGTNTLEHLRFSGGSWYNLRSLTMSNNTHYRLGMHHVHGDTFFVCRENSGYFIDLDRGGTTMWSLSMDSEPPHSITVDGDFVKRGGQYGSLQNLRLAAATASMANTTTAHIKNVDLRGGNLFLLDNSGFDPTTGYSPYLSRRQPASGNANRIGYGGNVTPGNWGQNVFGSGVNPGGCAFDGNLLYIFWHTDTNGAP